MGRHVLTELKIPALVTSRPVRPMPSRPVPISAMTTRRVTGSKTAALSRSRFAARAGVPFSLKPSRTKSSSFWL